MTPELFTAWREALGGRRFLMTMGAHAVNTGIFVFTPKMNQSGYEMLFMATVGAYLAAASYQKWVDKGKANASDPQG